jgi:ABC-type oligopeptide transport system ATPase subunit
VRLSPEHRNRYPRFSGGQLQRVAIAALALSPKLLVLETVSSLDVRSGRRHQPVGRSQELGLAYLFIAHDLALVRHGNRIAVMYLGRIVEQGPPTGVPAPKLPPPGRALSRDPLPGPCGNVGGSGSSSRATSRRRRRPPGCRFHTRCPLVMDVCRAVARPPDPRRRHGVLPSAPTAPLAGDTVIGLRAAGRAPTELG